MKVIRVKCREPLKSVSDKIALMDIYREEWKHRDQVFQSYFWRIVYLSLIITFLPDFLKTINADPEILQSFPPWVFPAAGIVCSAFGLFLGAAENKRIQSIDETYRRLLKSVTKTHVVKMYEKPYLKIHLNTLLYFVVYIMTIILATINLIIILIDGCSQG